MNKKIYPKIVSTFLITMIFFIFPVSAYWMNGTILNNSDSTGLHNTLIYKNNTIFTYSNITGYYSLDNATSGNFTFSNNPKFYQNITNITITSNTIKNINLTLKPTGTITGCVYIGEFGVCGGIQAGYIVYSKRVIWFW